jgi:uncharacterized membrane protein YoaK (UPF0700 family)
MVLTAAAASSDALSYLGLGHVFPANMTGNTVLLGLGVATGDWGAAARSAVALAAYVLAAFTVGTITAGRGSPSTLRWVLGVEVVLLAAFAGWWISIGAYPTGPARYGLVTLAGAAMGAQSAAVQQLRVPGVATTYITGTWTSLAQGLSQRVRGLTAVPYPLQALVLVTYAVTAFLAAAAFTAWQAVAALIPVAALTVAVTRPLRHR